MARPEVEIKVNTPYAFCQDCPAKMEALTEALLSVPKDVDFKKISVELTCTYPNRPSNYHPNPEPNEARMTTDLTCQGGRYYSHVLPRVFNCPKSGISVITVES